MDEKRTAKLVSGLPEVGHGNKSTYFGLVKILLEEEEKELPTAISRNWKASTWNTFVSVQNAVLRYIPHMKTMESFRDEDFEKVLEYARQKNGEKYSDITLLNFASSMARVYAEGVKRKLYKNKLKMFDLYYVGEITSTEEYESRLSRIRKSFTPEEEIRILRTLLKDPALMSGEEIGLLIMFLTAVRENEACGLDFGDFRDILDQTAHAMWIYETSQINSSKRKAGGKTRNANRILPIFDFLFDFIQKRKQYLQTKIDSGEIQLSDKFRTADDFPVVCIGNNYKKRCPSKYLTYAGRKLFQQLNMGGMNLRMINALIHESSFQEYDIGVKDPTTYLFRRNRGTSYYHTGMEPSLIQYCMGQKIESPDYSRNMLTGEKYLAEIKKRIDMLPINQYILQQEAIIKDLSGSCFNNVYRQKMTYFNEDSDVVRIRIRTKEPNDEPMVWILTEKPFNLVADSQQIITDYPKTVNVLSRMQELYAITEKGGILYGNQSN